MSKLDKKLKDGINVILPTYKGEKRILKCLDSFALQTLDRGLFEIVIVVNGEKDSSPSLIEKFQSIHTDLNIQTIVIEQAGVGNARNIGIEIACRTYITFVDDDDYVSNNYLEALYQKADENTIVISEIVDVDLKGKEDPDNSISKQIKTAKQKKDLAYNDLITVLTMNSLKLISTFFLKQISYDVHLKSGEDLVFFTELLIKFDFKIKFTETGKAIYYRVLQSDSVSRQKISFRFHIQERLMVIERLNQLLFQTREKDKQHFIKSIIYAHISFFDTYLREYPGHRLLVVNEIQKYDLVYFPFIENELSNKVKRLEDELKEKNKQYYQVIQLIDMQKKIINIQEKKFVLHDELVQNMYKMK